MISIEKENHQFSIAKKVFILFIGRLLPTLVLVLITVLYSRKLSFYDYGMFQSIWMYINLSSIIFAFGLPTAVLTIDVIIITSYIRKNKKKIFGFWLLIFLIVNGFLYSNIHLDYNTKLVGSVLILMQAFISIKEAFLIKEGKEVSILMVNFIYAIVFFIWHYYVATIEFQINLLLSGLIGLQVLRIIVFQFMKNKKVYSNQAIHESTLITHIRNFGINDTLNILSKWLDKLILVYFITPQEFAIFFNGTYEVPFISTIVGALGSIFVVKMAGNANTNENLISLFSNGFRLLSNIVFPIFFLFLFFSADIFDVIFSKRYEASISIFLVSILVLPLRINSYTTILQSKYKSNIIITGSIIDIVIAAILMVLLYQIWGLQGVALSIVLSTYVQAIYYLIQSGKVLSIPVAKLIPYSHLIKKFVIIFILFILFSRLMIFEDKIFKVILACIFTITVISACLIVYFRSNNLIFTSAKN